jgi:hypothetical protein
MVVKKITPGGIRTFVPLSPALTRRERERGVGVSRL